MIITKQMDEEMNNSAATEKCKKNRHKSNMNERTIKGNKRKKCSQGRMDKGEINNKINNYFNKQA